MIHIRTIVTAAALGVVMAGCGGGGSTPARPSTGTTGANATAQSQSVTISIDIPGREPAGVRRATYVGAGTQSAVVTVTAGTGVQTPSPASTTVNCTTTCQATVAAYPGSNTFAVSLYDGPNGTGFLLSSGSATATIGAGANTVNLTFNGVPFAVMALPNPPTLPSGTPGTTTLAVTVFDADANIITGPGTFTTPVTLATDSSHVTLSPATLTSPSQTSVTATYDGTAVACNTSVLIAGTIGSVTGPAGGFGVTTGVPCGLSVNPPGLTIPVGGSAPVTVTDPGFNGTISVQAPNVCAINSYATISPSSASGPSATFTVTGNMPTSPTTCPITFTDGTNTTTLSVAVN